MYSCTSPCEVSWVVFFARLVKLLEETILLKRLMQSRLESFFYSMVSDFLEFSFFQALALVKINQMTGFTNFSKN